LIEESVASGCRKHIACNDLNLSARTVERWQKAGNLADGRKNREFTPPNKLTPEQHDDILKLANSKAFRDLSPQQIVPTLLDLGLYYASASTFYRILRKAKLMAHRGPQRMPTKRRPKAVMATGPNQVWTWDITYLPSAIRGKYHYLYMILDIFSRKIVGGAVYDQESAEHASQLIGVACRCEQVKPGLVLHSDNGGPMKGATMLAKLQDLGVTPSFSRPAVSNDNPYSESLFRTLKYRPNYPEKCFEDLAAAQCWVSAFIHWYNNEHLHSALKYVTPNQRHTGADAQILANRQQVLMAAKKANSCRWSGPIRNWLPPMVVYLNPSKPKSGHKHVT